MKNSKEFALGMIASLIAICIQSEVNAGGKPQVSEVTLSMEPSKWNILYSTGMPPTPYEAGVNSWGFDFPAAPGLVSYITQRVAGSITGAKKLVAQITVTVTSGTPIFDYQTETGNTCNFPAHVRFYLEKAWSNKDFVRWWANPIAFELKEGSGTLSVNLDPSQWTDTWGQRGDSSFSATRGFKSTLSSPSQIGMTFGGGCFFGHGVRVKDGTAKFTVTNFSIQPQ